MPRCSFCQKSFLSVNGLFYHLSLQHHNDLRVIKCMEGNCRRLICGWRTFRKHLITKHNCCINAPASVKNTFNVEQSPNLQLYSNSADPNESDILHEIDDHANEYQNVISPTDIKQQFLSQAITFISKLYANPALPRNHVQVMVSDIQEFLEEVLSFLKPSILSLFENVDTEIKEKIDTLFNCLLQPFGNDLKTEFLRFKVLRDTQEYVEARNYVVGDRVDDLYSDGRIIQERIAITAKFVSIREMLSKFLSLPGVFKEIKSYMDYLAVEMNSGVISNFVQGQLWQEKVKNFPDKFVLPLFIYFDDLEVNNPLGSHAGIQKLGVVYWTIPCLPPECQSSIDNIFLTLLFHSSD